MLCRCALIVAVTCLMVGRSYAASELILGIDPRNTVPGVVANGILTEGGGHWTSSQLLVELTSGSVYNGTLMSDMPQQGFWGLFPDMQFDTWVGVPGNLTNNVANWAEEFDFGPISMSGNKISVAWLAPSFTQSALTQIANISLTDDAQGTYSLLATYSSDSDVMLSGTISNGAFILQTLPPPFPEPGTLALILGPAGLALGRRKQAPAAA